KRKPTRDDDDAEGGGPVGDRARGAQEERPEREERVVGAAVAVGVAEDRDAAVPAEIPAEKGPKRTPAVLPVVVRVGDRAGFDPEHHAADPPAQPDRPDRPGGERGASVEDAQEPITDGQSRRDGAHGRNALRHPARITSGRETLGGYAASISTGSSVPLR